MSEKTPPILVETPSQRFAVFLSHNSKEKPVVERIAEKLKRAELEPWLDKWCLTPAGDWQDELAAGVRASSACAVFIGPHGIGSWEDLEYKLAVDRMAKDRSFRVFLVLLPGLPEPFDTSALPPFLSTRTWVDLRKGIEDPRSFQSFIHAIKGLPLGPERPIEPRDDVCPYRGLQTFDEDHAEFFFGRDGDIQRLLEKLKTTRFLAVVGASGSGKSSLVRAGVIPALKKGVLPESDTWTIRVFTPGAHPLAALAANLLRLHPQQSMNRTLDEMNMDERTLHLAVTLAMAERPAAENVVWVVDQFEEIFTLCTDDKEREQFLSNLLYAAFIPGGRNVVLLTMRADFYQKCAAYPELSTRVAAQQFLVSPMDQENLKQAIEEPAWHVGLEFEQGLVETILDDIESQPGALPLLEHALLELWERRRGTLLTLEAYRESGGVTGAIAKRADAIYDSFTPEQQLIVRRIMLRLTQPGEGTEDTRRRATIDELVTRTEDSKAVEDVTQAMATARLLTTGSDEPGKETIDVSHEALIRGWPRLRKWIEEDRAGLRILRRLTEAAREWQPAKDESLLYRGARLAQAVEWRERNEASLNEVERTFLNSSVVAQQAIERRRKRVIFGLAAGMIIAAALAVFAAFQWRRADEQAKIAISRQLSAQALTLIDNDPELALLLGVEAARIHESFEARSILLQNLQHREHLAAFLHGHTEAVHKVVFSPDGKLLASVSGTNGKDNSVRLWDADSDQPDGQPLTGHQGTVRCVSFSPDGRILVSGDDEGVIILWDVATRNHIGQPLIRHEGPVHSLAFSPDSKILASGGFGTLDVGTDRTLGYIPRYGDIYLWNVSTLERIGESLKGHTGYVSALAFSPDGRILASGSGGLGLEADEEYSIILWDVLTRQALGSPLNGHRDAVLSMAFSPDGRVLVSGSMDNTVRLWNVFARKPLAHSTAGNFDRSGPHTNPVLAVGFTRDGKTLFSADAGNHVRARAVEFSIATGNNLSLVSSQTTKSIIGYFRRMESVALSPDMSKWAVGGCRKVAADGFCIEGEVSIWDVAARLPISHPISANSDPVRCVAFSPDSKTLATGGCSEFAPGDCPGGEVHLWDTATRQPIGQPLSGAPDAVTSLAYSPNGRTLAAGSCGKLEEYCRQGEIRLWDPDTQQLISQPLAGHNSTVDDLVFSPDGNILASTDNDSIILWNVDTRQQLVEITPDYPVLSIEFSPDGKTLASSGCEEVRKGGGCIKGEVRLWNVATRQLLGKLIGHTDRIASIAFSPDGRTLASASDISDGTIKLWNVATRQPVGPPLTGHVSGVEKVVISPDGETLASVSNGSRDNTYNIVLWDLATRRLIGQPLVGYTTFVREIAFSPDGRMLASGDHDKSLLLWDMNLESWKATACRVANRNMTRAEWERYFPDQPYRKTCPNLPEPSRE